MPLLCRCPVVYRIAVMICLLALPPGLAAQTRDNAVPSVIVTEVAERDVSPKFEYVGRVEAVDRVEMRARVEGFLEAKNFRDGSLVKRGDVLFKIEQAPYEAVRQQRLADLASAEASLKEAELDLARKQELRKKRIAAQADLDSATASKAKADAAVLQAKASLRRAELDMSYTEIASPIDGQINRSRYSVGSLVGPTSEPLAHVTSIDPIYVTIAISEKILIDARRNGINLENPPVQPSLILGDGSTYPEPGNFDYLDPEVNQSTDTILARATFANPQRVLVPGQYVKVVVQSKTPTPALVVPQSAVQTDQKGPFVLVVNRADKVEVRYIETGRQIDRDWVVKSGLHAAERVIVQGIQKVRPDMTVKPVTGES